MKQCSHCQRIDSQVKNGKTSAGSQIYKCKTCKRKYTRDPKINCYAKDKRQQAIRLVLDGNSKRQAACHPGVSHGTVANWFKQYADELPDELLGTGIAVDVAEQDELFTFIGQKKTRSTS